MIDFNRSKRCLWDPSTMTPLLYPGWPFDHSSQLWCSWNFDPCWFALTYRLSGNGPYWGKPYRCCCSVLRLPQTTTPYLRWQIQWTWNSHWTWSPLWASLTENSKNLSHSTSAHFEMTKNANTQRDWLVFQEFCQFLNKGADGCRVKALPSTCIHKKMHSFLPARTTILITKSLPNLVWWANWLLMVDWSELEDGTTKKTGQNPLEEDAGKQFTVQMATLCRPQPPGALDWDVWSRHAFSWRSLCYLTALLQGRFQYCWHFRR